MAGKLRYHRYFFNIMGLMLGQPPEACDMNGVCGMQYVVEADGSPYHRMLTCGTGFVW